MLIDAILDHMTPPRAISPKQLKTILKKLGISQMELSRRLGVDGRTVRRWLSGEATIPGPACVAIEAMVHLNDLQRILGGD